MNFNLVYLDAAHTKFGLILTPKDAGTPADSGTFAQFSCGGNSWVWRGRLLGQITTPPLNTSTTTATLALTSSGSTQTYQQIEGAGTSYHLYQHRNGGAGTNMALTTNVHLTFAKTETFLP